MPGHMHDLGFGLPALELSAGRVSADGAVFQYRSGDAATIVCYNFALRDTVAMDDRLRSGGVAMCDWKLALPTRMVVDAVSGKLLEQAANGPNRTSSLPETANR